MYSKAFLFRQRKTPTIRYYGTDLRSSKNISVMRVRIFLDLLSFHKTAYWKFTLEFRFLEPSIIRTSRYLEPKVISLSSIHWRLKYFTLDFSNQFRFSWRLLKLGLNCSTRKHWIEALERTETFRFWGICFSRWFLLVASYFGCVSHLAR